MRDLELRHFEGVEVRADAESRRITLRAAPFLSESVDFGWFKEQIDPRAFDRTLRERPDVLALYDHDTGKVLARVGNGTMKCEVKSDGLWTDFEPNQTTWGNDTYECVKRGDVKGASIGMRVMEDKWETRDGKDFRTLLDVELIEISVVAFPAYPQTSAEARSVEKVWEARQAALAGQGMTLATVKRKIAIYDLIG